MVVILDEEEELDEDEVLKLNDEDAYIEEKECN
jgi:hypothetical protein